MRMMTVMILALPMLLNDSVNNNNYCFTNSDCACLLAKIILVVSCEPEPAHSIDTGLFDIGSFGLHRCAECPLFVHLAY